MLKLPSIVCGVALILWGGIQLSPWLVAPGLVVLWLGLFFFRLDFGTAGGGPRPATGGPNHRLHQTRAACRL